MSEIVADALSLGCCGGGWRRTRSLGWVRLMMPWRSSRPVPLTQPQVFTTSGIPGDESLYESQRWV